MSVFKEYFVDTIKERYADFDGRARRSEYWYFYLFYVLITFGISFFLGTVGAALNGGIFAMISSGLLIIFAIGMFIPTLSVTVRRLHDTGKSGWWILIGIVPLIGAIAMLVFLCTDSEPGTNLYGPNPKTLSASNASDHLIDNLD